MNTLLRRGFKAEANRTSLALREELGLHPWDRLRCTDLADHLGIPVIPLSELRTDGAKATSVSRLLSSESGFSALTICAGTKRLIVYNPSQPPGRRANSLAHELSHVILKHPPSTALGLGGCRRWDAQLEAEADWQAAALLVPREGALAWLLRRGSIENGARHFGVSQALFQWRVNQTGVMLSLTALEWATYSDGCRPPVFGR